MKKFVRKLLDMYPQLEGHTRLLDSEKKCVAAALNQGINDSRAVFTLHSAYFLATRHSAGSDFDYPLSRLTKTSNPDEKRRVSALLVLIEAATLAPQWKIRAEAYANVYSAAERELFQQEIERAMLDIPPSQDCPNGDRP